VSTLVAARTASASLCAPRAVLTRALPSAGTHYIAFDLFVGRWIVLDAVRAAIPHLAVVWLLPLTLMAGPVGLTAYLCLVKPAWRARAWIRVALLRLLFAVVWVLSLSMAGWVLFFPASFRSGDWLGAHDAQLGKAFAGAAASGSPMPTPLSLLTKYSGHRAVQVHRAATVARRLFYILTGAQTAPRSCAQLTAAAAAVCCAASCLPSPQLTHILPSAVWSLAIPIQLNPAMRSHYKGLHRATGLAFFGCAGLMALGLTLIDGRNLFYFVVDFPSIPTHESMSAFGFMEHSSVDSFKTKYRCLGAWFTLTFVLALVSRQPARQPALN
jgi:hypothetical protein